MKQIGEKIIKLQDAKYKIQQNNSNEASIFISGSLATKLNLVSDSKITFIINKEDVIKLLCFTFSFKKTIYQRQEEVNLDSKWFEKMFALINNHFNVSSDFIFQVKKQSHERYYFIALEQSSGLNIRDLLIQDHVKLQFIKEENFINKNLIKIECSDIEFTEDSKSELTSESSMIIQKKVLRQFDFKSFHQSTLDSRLNISEKLILRFIASLTSKPFVILSGLSGSGKTKIAQSFVQWICESSQQYKIVPVGADWTNREPLVGYPSGLSSEEYITPDSGVINLLMEAVKEENENKPFFLILDEMNLSHVERYFADFLSIMESKDTIKLYTGNLRESLNGLTVPLEIGWPKNVFMIGTVNIDETTYMFSPKVLDRANVIEFRITEDEINSFLANPGIPDLSKLTKEGVTMSESFLSIANKDEIIKNNNLTKELVSFFNHLQPVGAEFGYRSASEIMQLVSKLKMLDKTITDNSCLDIAIMQKLLPKLHGSRSKLVKILIALSGLCVEGITLEEFEKKFDDFYKNDFEGIVKKYPISFEKIIRMYKNVLSNGFTSYAEA